MHSRTQRLIAFSAVLAEWLRKWVRVYSIGLREPIQLAEEDYALYAEALGDLAPDQLDAACRKAGQTCAFFPKPPHIRAQFETVDAAARGLEEETKWQELLDYVGRYVYPDFPGGLARNAPNLEASVEFAARAAGGLRFLESCSTEDLIWAKKRFCESLAQQRKTGEGVHLLSSAESRKLLDRIQRGESFDAPQPKQLPPSVPTVSAQPAVPPRAEPKKPETPAVELSDEEWERKRAEDKRRFREHCAAQGIDLETEQRRFAESDLGKTLERERERQRSKNLLAAASASG